MTKFLKKEKKLQFFLFIITLLMIVLRFLLNEKGRTNPDSIRFMRTAHIFPIIDNTTAPLGYPLSLKFFTMFGLDEFWASKVVGILSYVFMIVFAWKKNFFLRETIVIGGLVSYFSLFAYTMSEPLILPFVLIFLYISQEIINKKYNSSNSILYLSLILIILQNIRYSSMFFIAGVLLFGIINIKKEFGKIFISSGCIALFFVALYKFFFIDIYNSNYFDSYLEIGLHPTTQLLVELFEGLTTSFNPFIHIADPGGGILNIFVYGIGFANILLMLYLFLLKPLSQIEKFFLYIGVFGILCSFFIQYFYSVNPLDYRLLAAFNFPIWLVYFNKLFEITGIVTYGIPILSLLTGLVFIWLTRGNYLENRKEVTLFLHEENLQKSVIYFFVPEEGDDDLSKIQMAELVSTINPNVNIVHQSKDTLKANVLTEYKVLRKTKIQRNKYQ